MTPPPAHVLHREDRFRSTDGVDLFGQSWSPDAPRAVVLLVHGVGEHSERHARTATHLAEGGYAVYAFDLRGHGRSSGRRCFVRAIDEYVSDLAAALHRARTTWPDAPVFLLGQSMGALLSVMLVIDTAPGVSGAILIAPAVRVGKHFSALQVCAFLLLGRLLPAFPAVTFPSSLLSRDADVVSGYRSDPLVYHGKAPARTASEIIRAIRRVESRFDEIDLPLLVMHGGDDRVADVEGSRRLHARARSEDKSLRVYEGLFHEILNEPERASVLGELTAWLEAHTEDRAAGEGIADR